ncbi:MAG: hypothetical protein KAS36_15295, partial [Anaerolineales bacterium]|nr:hypothetical protein [Anaerolineales bacterium]
SGMYSHNKVGSNVVGVKGELATALWLENEFKPSPDYLVPPTVLRHYENTTPFNGLPGDVQIEYTGGTVSPPIEIKGLRRNQWNKWKRMIPPRQLKKYCREKAVVIWIVADTQGVDQEKVILKGWNFASEVDEFGIEYKTICDNIWLQEDEKMRPMDSLLSSI